MAQSRTQVNAKASPAEGMHKVDASVIPGGGQQEDLGGPSPENYKSTDDSSKLDAAKGATETKSVVNAKAGAKDSAPSVSPAVVPSTEGPRFNRQL